MKEDYETTIEKLKLENETKKESKGAASNTNVEALYANFLVHLS